MKKVGLIATIVIAAMLIAGCGNSNNADNKTTVNESLTVSSSVGNTENNNSEIVKENQNSTEVATTELTTAETTTRKETTTTQTKQTTTKKETTTKKVTTTEAPYFCDEGGTHHSCEVGQIGWVNSYETAQNKALEYIAENNTSGNFRVKECFYCGKFTATVTLR